MFKTNMRLRIMSHYAGSFFAICLLLVAINVLYMVSFVYRDESLYSFVPGTLVEALNSGIKVTAKGPRLVVTLDPAVAKTLTDAGAGLQIIDQSLNQVYRQAVSPMFPTTYTPVDLVNLYDDKTYPLATVFVAPLKLTTQATIDQVGSDNEAASQEHVAPTAHQLTAILIFNSDQVKRTNYTYDVSRFKQAYNIYWLLAMNLLIVLMFSYLYTYSISRPVHRLVTRIFGLSKGNYAHVHETKGIYREVEVALNHLGESLHQAEVAEAKAQSTREAWIANLSHDIKTPLTSMMGYGEIIGDTLYPLTDQERQHYSLVLKEKGQYIQGLISDLNLAARLKHKAQALRLDQVELVGFLKKLLVAYLNSSSYMSLDQQAQAEANHKDQANLENTLAFTHAQDQVWCMIDQHLFKRVLYNLLTNAWHHNPKGTHVRVHLETSIEHGTPGATLVEHSGATLEHLGATLHSGATLEHLGATLVQKVLRNHEVGDLQWIRMTIEDNGLGVNDDELAEIFTRYYRGTHTEANSEGSGLGLAIAKDIVEAHGGQITASRGEAGGLKITITLRPVVSGSLNKEEVFEDEA